MEKSVCVLYLLSPTFAVSLGYRPASQPAHGKHGFWVVLPLCSHSGSVTEGVTRAACVLMSCWRAGRSEATGDLEAPRRLCH